MDTADICIVEGVNLTKAKPVATAQRPHTAGLTAYLPSFLPALFPRPGALLQLVVDAERHILYARSQTSGIQVRGLLGIQGLLLSWWWMPSAIFFPSCTQPLTQVHRILKFGS